MCYVIEFKLEAHQQKTTKMWTRKKWNSTRYDSERKAAFYTNSALQCWKNGLRANKNVCNT